MKVLSLVSVIGVVYALACTVECATPYSRSVNDVGFAITKRLGGKDNLMISPISIYVTMAMVYAGARGQSRSQILDGLNATWRGVPTAEFFLNTKNIVERFDGKQQGYSLSMANGLFAQEGFELHEGFRRVIESGFKGTLKNVDFAKRSQQAMKTINDWAADKTGNMITDLLKQPLDPSTQLALLNAIHFKGTWKKEFNASFTSKGPFFNDLTNPGQYTAEFMEMRKVKFDYMIDPVTKYKFLEMPYKGGQTSMLIALPIDEDQFPDLEMTEEILNRITRKSNTTRLDRVVLPKFSFKYGTDLKNVLIDMGIKDIFSSNADLTGISEQGNIRVSSVFQETAIEVNEQGSEASGVTGVIIEPTSIRQRVEFVADHPFLFYILDFNTDIVLFSGRVVKP